MTRETLVLVGRTDVAGVAERHAARLRDRGVVDAVETATYRTEPEPELRETLSGVSGDRTYVVPLCFAHTLETLRDLPRALGRLPVEVRYCDPIGESPGVTAAIRSRARAASDADALLLVALGNSRESHARDAVRFHADRLRETFPEIRCAYLLQSPAVECARYTLSADHVVACPLFLADCDATRERIPEALELDRGGIDYADPLGDAPAVTDAIAAEIDRERVLAESGTRSPGTDLVANARPVATDGRGDE